MVTSLISQGVHGEWHAGDLGHGRTFCFASPDGHALELYFEAERFVRRRTGSQVSKANRRSTFLMASRQDDSIT